MTRRPLRRGLPALALMASLVCGVAAAGDAPVIFPGAGHQVVGAAPGCLNCTKHNTRLGSDCPTCVNGKYGIGWRKRPTAPTLAPGACFGYFPTQWSRWQDVCPLPYPGVGEPPLPTTSTAVKKPDTAPPPKPSSDDTPPADPGTPPTGLKEKGTGKPAELPLPDTLPKVPEKPKGGATSDLPMPNIPTAPLPGPANPPKAAPQGGKP